MGPAVGGRPAPRRALCARPTGRRLVTHVVTLSSPASARPSGGPTASAARVGLRVLGNRRTQ
ncbi:hypothetical protein STRAU_0651 [Streptomyces aurantiacus JA 4570]|uniref:Uncharacterized protein n=1 Tax=Streptomyces aurantiacus JA 4570 TaxID=1286094 RepID=S3ZU40_9ACTN|nr:hypothetical protein STRAU_0651 [Streptomyces aurantiacus JA 4570]